MAIKIILADDHKIVRQGLRTMLESEADIEVIGEADDGRMAVRLARELSPQVIIMDVGMPDLNGIEATRQVLAESPGIKVIGLSMHCDRRFVMNMLKAGASGYLLKDSAFEELAGAIRMVLGGKVYLSTEIANIVVKDYLQGGGDESVFSVLTPREREVLQLMAEGKSSRQIADHLIISIKTVETHRMQIMHKLQIFSVAELTKYAIREGLSSLD
ncbi:MAG: DNA-binding response regulator [Deltaproteobacteria bacterium]|nr:MAG: DNA-binding response regulator [Deltaproteobacteria bacterium]